MKCDQPSSMWSKREDEYVEYCAGLRGLKVPERLDLEEAIALFELWKATGVFSSGKLEHC